MSLATYVDKGVDNEEEFIEKARPLLNQLILNGTDESDGQILDIIKEQALIAMPEMGMIFSNIIDDNYVIICQLAVMSIMGGHETICYFSSKDRPDSCEGCAYFDDCVDQEQMHLSEYEFYNGTNPGEINEMVWDTMKAHPEYAVSLDNNFYYDYEYIIDYVYDKDVADAMRMFFAVHPDREVIINHAQKIMFDDLFDDNEGDNLPIYQYSECLIINTNHPQLKMLA